MLAPIVTHFLKENKMSDTQNAAANPAEAAVITANHDPKIDVKETTFNFRKSKDPETGVETKRESVVGRILVPSVEGVIAILQEGGKGLELLMQSVESTLVEYAKQVISDDTSITSDNFPTDKITWDVLANLPDTDRRGRGIPKEVWEDFVASYIEHMPAIIGKPVEVVKKQASILAQKFQPLRTHEKKNDLLPKFIEMLSLYANNVSDAEQFSAPIEFLVKKADQYMNQEAATDLADNLGF